MNIFEIERSKRDADFIKQNGELELEVAADIIETYKDVPYVVLSLNLGRFYQRQRLVFYEETGQISHSARRH